MEPSIQETLRHLDESVDKLRQRQKETATSKTMMWFISVVVSLIAIAVPPMMGALFGTFVWVWQTHSKVGILETQMQASSEAMIELSKVSVMTREEQLRRTGNVERVTDLASNVIALEKRVRLVEQLVLSEKPATGVRALPVE